MQRFERAVKEGTAEPSVAATSSKLSPFRLITLEVEDLEYIANGLGRSPEEALKLLFFESMAESPGQLVGERRMGGLAKEIMYITELELKTFPTVMDFSVRC